MFAVCWFLCAGNSFGCGGVSSREKLPGVHVRLQVKCMFSRVRAYFRVYIITVEPLLHAHTRVHVHIQRICKCERVCVCVWVHFVPMRLLFAIIFRPRHADDIGRKWTAAFVGRSDRMNDDRHAGDVVCGRTTFDIQMRRAHTRCHALGASRIGR